MIVFQLEKNIEECEYETNDGGAAKSIDMAHPELPNAPCDEDSPGLWVKIISWDPDQNHSDFKKLIGKKIRVTVEVEDPSSVTFIKKLEKEDDET